ncbi:MAG TPA: hypothetical protein EYP39_09120 [Ghiorsea sp.]|nr:hypothetical protein [Ghiorsea sp.]HIP07513.1 hypothetical protein [Mariprofundaceae bacterium]
MFYFIIALTVVVLLATEFSARQLSTVALDVGLSFIRIVLPLLIVLLVQELFSRDFERKIYLAILTYPRSRTHWLISRVGSIFIIALAALALMAFILALLTVTVEARYSQATPISLGIPYFITLGFIAVDMLVVLAISTFLAMSATTTSFVLVGTVGLTMIARSYTPIIELLQGDPYVVGEHVDPQLYQDSLGLIAFILPDLGRLDVRMIALYDKMIFLPADWMLLLASACIYALALFALAAWVLNKREFS